MAVQASEAPTYWFSGHESFSLRHGWLPKAVNSIKAHPDLFNQNEALVWLGVGKNMVRSIRHWALATGVLREGVFREGTKTRSIETTDIGELIFGKGNADPYLEDPASLWLMHWNLASQPDGPTTWWWMFNELQDAEFTKERIVRGLLQLVDRTCAKAVAQTSLSRDFDCFIRTYLSTIEAGIGVSEETLECPLTDLGLLQQLDEGVVAFNRGEHPSLPSAIVAYATIEFWDRVSSHKHTLTFDQVAYQPGSPGRVFRLTENALSEHLEAMEKLTHKAVTYDVTAGLRQLYRRKDTDSLSLLREFYGGNGGRK